MKNGYKEIGSEFWTLESCDKKNSLFPKDTSWFLSGRGALSAIIEDIKAKGGFNRVAMPSWCCESMIKPFIDYGIEVCFYSVAYKDGKLTRDFGSTKKADALFVIDYFGYEQDSVFDFDGPIIRDITHSIFTKKHSDCHYSFGSLRKWSGFLTGGFAFGLSEKKELPKYSEYISLRNCAMEMKRRFIEGGIGDKSYLSVYSEAEERLDNCGMFGAEEQDILSANMLDVDFIKKKRCENAAFLISELRDFLMFDKLGENDCPLFVPLLLPENKRAALRSYLIEKSIYCPIHWPLSAYHKLDKESESIYRKELSLVCDQRYGLTDMERTVNEIKKFFKR